MKAIDIHAHIFSKVNGANNFGPVVSEKFGRVTNGGEVKPFMPPLSKDTSFAPEMLLELMAGAEVEKAVLMQNPTIGIINDEIAASIAAHPDKFVGVLQVDPFAPGAAEKLEKLAASGKFCALKLEMSDDWGWLSIHPRTDFHFTELYPLMDIVKSRGMKVIFDPGSTTGAVYYPNEYEELFKAYPEIRFTLEHMGYMTGTGDIRRYFDMLTLGRLDNVSFGISAMGQVLAEEYPCPRALTLMQEAYRIIGAGKLMWGSDCPTTLNRYTYRQMKDLVERRAEFLTDSEKQKILYDNANEMFFA